MGYKTVRRLSLWSGTERDWYDFEDEGTTDTEDGGTVREWVCDIPWLAVNEVTPPGCESPSEYEWYAGVGLAHGTASSFEAAVKCAVANRKWRD